MAVQQLLGFRYGFNLIYPYYKLLKLIKKLQPLRLCLCENIGFRFDNLKRKTNIYCTTMFI